VEGAKYWLGVLTEIKNRGVEDVCIAVCDGLKGLPEAITTVWEQSTVQTCVIHLIRNTFRYAPRQHWDELSRDLKPVYTAPTEAAAREQFGEFEAKWATKYPAIGRLWRNAWAEFTRSLTVTPRSAGYLFDQHDRIPQRPPPTRGAGTRPFPERCRGAENASTSCPVPLTPPGRARHDGPRGGSRP
jgi:hypothetical protein